MTQNRILPKGGWQYTEGSIPWHLPQDYRYQPMKLVVRAIQTARANNPLLNLDPSFVASQQALIDATCARVPDYCDTAKKAVAKNSRRTGCRTCGKKRRK